MNTGKMSHRAVILGLVALLLAACAGGDAARLQQLPPDAVILAFGDSLTYGTGAEGATPYPQALSRLIGRTVVNAGVPGELSAQGLTRLPELLSRHRPQLLLLCHGGNDILRGRSREQLKANLRGMIEAARAGGTEVAMIAVPEFGIFLSAAPEYAEVAAQLDVPLVNDALADIIGAAEFRSDGVHPNAAGYLRLATAVEALLMREGAL